MKFLSYKKKTKELSTEKEKYIYTAEKYTLENKKN